ncbi:MAG: hypothetical protein HYY38_02865 [Rhodospirillales bacterium]|nr:hypothetical protein [Rhodospirillales bacterium]
MNIKTTLKTSVAAAALFALAAPVATPASADIKNGNKNSLTISGWVAKALWYADDGEQDQLFITDGSTSRSRVRWIASGTVNEDVTAGALIEMDIPLSNPQDNQLLTDNGETSGPGTDKDWAIRHQYVWVNHKKFGKLALGQTDAAANGNMEGLLSGTTAIDLSSAKPFGSGLTFINDTGATPSRSATNVNAVIKNLDFTSRTDVIRYDTPSFKGFGLAASLNGAGGGEVGGRYTCKFNAFSVEARAGYSENSSSDGAEVTNGDYTLGGSVAVLHDSGLNASFAGGKVELETGGNRTPYFWYVSGGYRAKIFKIGGTDFNVGYNRSKQMSAKGDEADSIGITALQNFDPIGANIAVFWRRYDLEQKRATAGQGRESFDEIDVFGLQTVFNF